MLKRNKLARRQFWHLTATSLALALLHPATLDAFPDFEESIKQANNGDTKAQAITATYYALGWQTIKDQVIASRYAKQSADAGDPLGKFRFGALLRSGEGIAKDEISGLRLQKEAVEVWLKKGYDRQDPFTITAFGVAMFQGKVMKQDKSAAAELYKKAADMDFAPAQFNFAMCARDGQGIRKESKTYTEYLSKAAKSDYPLAVEYLGQGSTPATPLAADGRQNSESASPSGPVSGSLKIFDGNNSNPPTDSASNSRELTVIGVGASPADAEKQAITNAVRQAVGAFVDANTLVQNEEVIRDRILAVSIGFVKEYKPSSPARLRDDGLYEITIIATVETNRVSQALKENNIISGEFAGQNIWAEATTKVMNAQDAKAMLEAKLPELLQSATIIHFLDRDGKVTKNTNPLLKSENPDGTIDLSWLVSLSIDKEIYRSQIVPLLKTCFEAITGSSPKYFLEKACSDSMGAHDQPPDMVVPLEILDLKFNRVKRGFFNNDSPDNPMRHGSHIVVDSISDNLELIQGFSFPNPRFFVAYEYRGAGGRDWPVQLKLTLLDAQGQTVSSKVADLNDVVSPFVRKGILWETMHNNSFISFCSPTFGAKSYSLGFRHNRGVSLSEFFSIYFRLNLPIDEAKKCEKIECKLIAPRLRLELKKEGSFLRLHSA